MSVAIIKIFLVDNCGSFVPQAKCNFELLRNISCPWRI